MSHCRWVVLAEDCYQQLTEVPQKAKEEEIVPRVPEVEPELVPEVAESKDTQTTESLVETPPLKEPEPAPDTEQVLDAADTVVEEAPETPTDWTLSVPPSFRKEAQNLLQKLDRKSVV